MFLYVGSKFLFVMVAVLCVSGDFIETERKKGGVRR